MSDKTILIADDDPALIRALGLRCKQLGLTVRTASNGQDAYEMIVRLHPDTAILDVNMPGAEGLDICENVMHDPQLSGMPVIILTGQANNETIGRCQKLGAHFVLKGIDTWDELEPLLIELLGMAPGRESATRSDSAVESSAPPPPASPPKVLCIDDDPAISKALQIKLRACGVEVVRAFNGMQGYRTALTEKPDVIISDFNMPEGHGNYLIGRLKTHPVTCDTPVIILTGRTLAGKKDFALERELVSLGAVKMLLKPLDFDALVWELQRYITIPQPPDGPKSQSVAEHC